MTRAFLVLVLFVSLTACMRIRIAPNGDIHAFIIGNGHAIVCQDPGETVRQRSPIGAPQGKDVPVATEAPDVTVQNHCTEVTGTSTSSNSAITIIATIGAACAMVIAFA